MSQYGTSVLILSCKLCGEMFKIRYKPGTFQGDGTRLQSYKFALTVCLDHPVVDNSPISLHLVQGSDSYTSAKNGYHHTLSLAMEIGITERFIYPVVPCYSLDQIDDYFNAPVKVRSISAI
jgi:hypothetical protein